MKISEITDRLGLTVIAGAEALDREITGGYTSDLLSDVIGNASAGNVWITLQSHHNVMAVAMLKEISAVIITRGIIPTEECIRKGNEEKIPVLASAEDSFTVSGRLFNLLKKE